MELKAKFNHWLPALLGVGAITISPFIFFKDPLKNVGLTILKHELIHYHQCKTKGWIKFYTLYLFYYFVQLSKHLDHSKAYFSIPFEIEAYSYEGHSLEELSILLELDLNDKNIDRYVKLIRDKPRGNVA